jgi:hypothetical protein
MLRSKSVQQPRPTNTTATNNNAKKAVEQANNPRSNSNAKPRPSSMYDGAKANKFEGSSISGKGKEQPRKTAFGHSAAASDKKNDINNTKLPSSHVKGSAPPPLKSSVKPPVNRNLGKGHDDDSRAEGLGMNGFSKLQNKVKNQPLIISYEEDDMHGVGIGGGRKGGGGGGGGRNDRRNYDDHGDYGGGGDLNLELRGQSRYIPVNERIDDFVDDHGGGGGRNKKGDQIDKLLSNARNGKYA